MQAVIESKLPAPALCISVSPCTDFSFSGASWTEQKDTELWMSQEEAQWFFEQCVGGKSNAQQLKTSNMNLLNGTFKGYPPTWVCTGGFEILKSDAELIAAAAKKDGVDITLRVAPNMSHNYQNFITLFPEAQAEMNKCVTWANKYLKA